MQNRDSITGRYPCGAVGFLEWVFQRQDRGLDCRQQLVFFFEDLLPW
jgi:hypothetical protein